MRSQPQETSGSPGAAVLLRERRQLINVAYRLLGSLSEAEDAVQEAWARWYTLSEKDLR